ncbi:MAG TPA: DUF2809 domain-containing protein [Tepidisphaeraceae bacterium]|nr:DUF2809 domain-containing protein [Tepidisphaeraceae bacterium]
MHVVLLLLIVPLGLASRRWPIGLPLYDDALGDALYAVMVYLVLAILFPARRPLAVAIAAAVVCLAIELFKLTGLPHAWRRSTLSRLVFGTSFGWHNLVRYGVGIACIALADGLPVRRRSAAQDTVQ